MCGRYAIFTEEENIEIRQIISEVNSRFKEEAPKMKTGEIFPTNIAPIITADDENNRQANLFKWGFPKFGQQTGVIINARAETLHEKSTFKKLVHSKRCLVPASGFYEWKVDGEKKEKHIIRVNNSNFFYMAGLYNTFNDKKGKPYTSFVIITTDASPQMSSIHNRMPVMFDKQGAYSWINASQESGINFGEILVPYKNRLIIEKAG